MDSVGQQRMAALHGGRRDRLEISPNLWAGVGLGARRRGHGAGRRSGHRCGAHRRVPGARHRYASSCPAIRTSRKPIASPSWHSPCSNWRRRRDHAGPWPPERRSSPSRPTSSDRGRPERAALAGAYEGRSFRTRRMSAMTGRWSEIARASGSVQLRISAEAATGICDRGGTAGSSTGKVGWRV